MNYSIWFLRQILGTINDGRSVSFHSITRQHAKSSIKMQHLVFCTRFATSRHKHTHTVRNHSKCRHNHIIGPGTRFSTSINRLMLWHAIICKVHTHNDLKGTINPKQSRTNREMLEMNWIELNNEKKWKRRKYDETIWPKEPYRMRMIPSVALSYSRLVFFFFFHSTKNRTDMTKKQ